MADGTTLNTQESNGALVANTVADSALNGCLDDQDQPTVEQRSALARGLYIYLNSYPICDGGVWFGSETAGSCCWSREMFVVRCEDYETRPPGVDTEALEPEAV